MESLSIDGNNVGDWIEYECSEAEVEEFRAIIRAEVIEEVKRESNGNGDGTMTLPPPKAMAKYCYQQPQLGQLKTPWQRKFFANLFIVTRNPTAYLSPSRRANLAKIYIEFGGKV
jgi:hypothetical protein